MELSQDFSGRQSHILGALSKLDRFLLNPQTRTLPGTVPGTSRSNDLGNREPTADRSQKDPQPEVEFSARPTTILTESDPEESSHR